jgi:hypothetical protein
MAKKRDDGRFGALEGLRRAEQELSAHLGSLREVIRSLESGGTRGAAGAAAPAGKKRNMSAKGRAAIARAARKRWAAYRAAQGRKGK